jgi:hypothetical protein
VSYRGWKTCVSSLALLATTLLLPRVLYAQSDDERPTLKRRDLPIVEILDPEPEKQVQLFNRPSTPLDELGLPRRGHAWALDANGDAKQFTRLNFSPTRLNNHKGENYAKAFTGEFLFRQRATVDIPGSRASVRLHDGSTTFYVQSLDGEDGDAIEDQLAPPRLNLVKLQVDSDHRVANTFLFRRIPEKAKRSEDIIATTVQRVGKSAWFKVTPMHPLERGEYALIPLPEERSEYSTVILDFAIDPVAPNSEDVITATGGTP